MPACAARHPPHAAAVAADPKLVLAVPARAGARRLAWARVGAHARHGLCKAVARPCALCKALRTVVRSTGASKARAARRTLHKPCAAGGKGAARTHFLLHSGQGAPAPSSHSLTSSVPSSSSSSSSPTSDSCVRVRVGVRGRLGVRVCVCECVAWQERGQQPATLARVRRHRHARTHPSTYTNIHTVCSTHPHPRAHARAHRGQPRGLGRGGGARHGLCGAPTHARTHPPTDTHCLYT